MAKKSMVNRDLKRAKLVKQHAAKRVDLKKVIASPDASYDEKMAAAAKLQKLPRDSSPSRLRTRCALTGRPRAVYAKFGLARSKLREATMRGDVPGLRKASWCRRPASVRGARCVLPVQAAVAFLKLSGYRCRSKETTHEHD